MTIDLLDNLGRYAALHPLLAQFAEFCHTHDLRQLPAGKTELVPGQLWLNVQQFDKRMRDDVLLEAHRDFLDIHIPLSGKEVIGYAPGTHCTHIVKDYDKEADIVFYGDKVESYASVPADSFAIFFPGEAHAPAINLYGLTKIIVKIKI